MRLGLLMVLLFVPLVVLSTKAENVEDTLAKADNLWEAGQVEAAAKVVYPLAIKSNAVAQMKLSYYAMILRKQGRKLPELPDWEAKARAWLLEIARNAEEAENAAGAAELLIIAVDGGALKFKKSEEAKQCWQRVLDCWGAMIEKKINNNGAMCIVAVDRALMCR